MARTLNVQEWEPKHQKDKKNFVVSTAKRKGSKKADSSIRWTNQVLVGSWPIGDWRT